VNIPPINGPITDENAKTAPEIPIYIPLNI